MRLQFEEFIEAGSGDTESAAVKNLLDANIIYLTVISESTPGVTVEENGLYYVQIGGAQYVRIKNTDADDTLEVYGAFDRIMGAE